MLFRLQNSIHPIQPPFLGENPGIDQPCPKIGTKPFSIGEKFGFAAGQRIGPAHPARHAGKDVGNAFDADVAEEPVLLRHHRQGDTGMVRQLRGARGKLSVDAVAIFGKGLVMQFVQCTCKQMVIENVHQHPRVATARGGHAGAALAEGWVRFGMAVDRAMQGHAARQVRRQAARQRPLDPVADDAADDQGRRVTGEQRVGEEVHGGIEVFSSNAYYPRMNNLLATLELQTGADPRFSVIWMHGLGADGSDFEPIVPELGLDSAPDVRFVFPNAPAIPVTCNGGYVMPAWYDIITLDSTTRRVDEAGIVRSRAAIRRLIERENRRGVPCQRIFLAGFSQGGAIAYTTALTHPERLAGVIALSTYIPTPQLLESEATAANAGLEIFAAHGTEDDVVAPELGTRARDLLLRLGCPVAWHAYPMPHSVCIEEVIDIGRWLHERMAVLDRG